MEGSSPPAFISGDALIKPQRTAALTVFRCTAKIRLYLSAGNLIQQIRGQQFISIKTIMRHTSCLAVSESLGFLLLELLQTHRNLVAKTEERQLELHSNNKLNIWLLIKIWVDILQLMKWTVALWFIVDLVKTVQFCFHPWLIFMA